MTQLTESTVYSFDVFDTLITRTVMRPAHTFLLAGAALRRGHEGAVMSPQAYLCARRAAERLARRRALPRDDCTFEEIFDAFPELKRWGITPQEAMDAELAAERRVMSPIVANITEVKRLQATGEQVLCLSDMYLPCWFVLELLTAQGVALAPNALYLSGESGLSKRSGRLFSFVLEQRGIPPTALHHVGDNHWSDVTIPRCLGIQATHTSEIEPTRYEQLPRPRRLAPISRSVSGGVARAARLVATTPDTDPAWAAFACDVAAPLLCGYVRWVLDHARRQGIRRLYFVSRDGQPLYRIALAMAGPDDPECRYLYGSRRAWLLPSVIRADSASLAWAWTRGTYFNAMDILRRLELDTPETHAVLRGHGFTPERLSGCLGGEDAAHLQRLILDSVLAERMLATAATRRDLLVRYLEQEGLLSEIPWALVEVGWILRPQHALQRVLHHAGAIQPAKGYYLGVAADHMPIAGCGEVWAYISHPRARINGQFRCEWFVKRATVALMENVFLAADHPSAIGYCADGERVVPVFDVASVSPRHAAFVSSLHAALCTYATTMPVADAFGCPPGTFARRALTVVKQFVFSPTLPEVAAFAWLHWSPDQGHAREQTYALARRLTVAELLGLTIQDLGLSHPRAPMPFFWLYGSLALSSWPVRTLGGFMNLLSPLAAVLRQARYALRHVARTSRRASPLRDDV